MLMVVSYITDVSTVLNEIQIPVAKKNGQTMSDQFVHLPFI